MIMTKYAENVLQIHLDLLHFLLY